VRRPGGRTFIPGVLSDPRLKPELRSKGLVESGSTSVSFSSIKRLPVDESLGSSAMRLVRSTPAGDRRAGAGLLGGVSTTASRGERIPLLGDSVLA